MPGSNSNCSRALSSRLEKVLNVNSGLTEPTEMTAFEYSAQGYRVAPYIADLGKKEA